MLPTIDNLLAINDAKIAKGITTSITSPRVGIIDLDDEDREALYGNALPRRAADTTGRCTPNAK